MNQQQSTLKTRLAVLILATQALSCGNLETLEPVQDGQAKPVVQTSGNAVSSTPDCVMQTVRYPTNYQDFQGLLYGNRGFLTVYGNSKHLGYDIVYPEGTAMHPIGCGTIKFYGPATGYGTLVAVVEHKLASSLGADNGDGKSIAFDTFLSIYGHMRKTTEISGGDELPWQVGDTVQPTDTIGYTQNDALNGDGPEHLHLGIRLQSAAEAKASDAAWFRGNDTPGDGQYKKYYSDPKAFIMNLEYFLNGNEFGDGEPSGTVVATHHPIGTLLHDVSGADYWLVVGQDTILKVNGYKHLPKACVVGISPQTVSCYTQTQFAPFSLYLDAKVIKFQGEPQVYQLYPGNGFAPTAYRTFLSYDSFLSWGYRDSDIAEYPIDQKSTQLGGLQDDGVVGMMPGALVKGQGQSEVAVADQDGKRRPIFDWDVFQDLGYPQTCIHEIDPTTLDAVAGDRSDQVIDVNEVMSCGSQPGYVCVPGLAQPCACGNGSAGNQTCQSGGQGFDACQCPTPEADAGTGGIGGSSGQSGTGGTSGQGDTGGSTGFGGQGGSGGTDAGIEPCGGHCAIGTVCVNNQCVLADAGTGGTGGSAPYCVPFSQIACSCGGGLSGYQACATDGMSYGPCIGCGGSGSGGSGGMMQDAGSPATGGSGGTSGSAGAGGTGSSGAGGSGGTSNTGGSGNTSDAGNPSGPCATQGVPGKTTFIINAPITPSNGISVYGWIHYPNWSGAADIPWSGWAWGPLGVSQISFQEGDAYQGAKYIFAPGVSPAAGQQQTAWYCEQNDCPVGTFIVCNGLQEACRFQNGILSGGASYTPNSANWQNMQCVL